MRRVGLGAVWIALMLVPCAASADEGMNRLDDQDVHELLRILTENDGWHFVEVRAAALASLRELVASGDDSIVDAALRRIAEGTPEQRRHAQLVLTQAEQVPVDRLTALRASPDLVPWAFGTISTLPAVPEIHDRDDPALYRRLAPTEPDPLDDVRWDVSIRLGDLAAAERAEQTWRVPAQPRITIDPPTEATFPDRYWFVDLDGDGREECVIVDVPSWSEAYQGEAYIAVLGRDTDEGRWHLRDLSRLDDSNHRGDVTVTDLDKDGDAELLVQYEWAGGWCWDYLTVIDAGRERWIHDVSQTHFGAMPFLLDRGDQTYIVTPSQYVEGATGKAVCLVGVLGYECTLERWTDDGPQTAGAVYTGALPGQPD